MSAGDAEGSEDFGVCGYGWGVWLIAGVVAATVAGPAFSASVDADSVAHWSRAAGGDGKAFALLVRGAWTEGEAKERGVSVSEADIRAAVGGTSKHGLTKKDVEYLARVGLLRAGIEGQVTQPAAESVTPQDVDAYVEQHPRMEPERRKIRVIQATSATRARQALRKL